MEFCTKGKESSRVVFADALKGFCICLMVLGHCGLPLYVERFVYLFHIPMFFFLSGYFFKPRNFGVEIARGARTLLLPYVIGCALVFIKYATDVLRGIDVVVLKRFASACLLIGPADGLGFLNLQIGPLWFLPALFFCRVLYIVIYKMFFAARNGNVLASVAAMLVSALSCLFFANGHSLLGICQAFGGLCFYACGAMLGKNGLPVPHVSKCQKLLPLCGMAFIAIAFVDSLDMYLLKFPLLSASLWVSVLATLFVFWLFKTVEKIWLTKILAYIGERSLFLLLVHNFEFMLFDWSRFSFLGVSLPLARLTIDAVVAIAVYNFIHMKKRS